MRIQSIIAQLNVDNIKKMEPGRKTSGSVKASNAKDSSAISSDAKHLSDTTSDINTVKSQTNAQPEVRTDKVLEVKEKIKNGYYNSEEFIDHLAEKLMKDFGIS
jgi:flagellar biosynthesis anti-sigma factor FlgM